MRPRHPDTRPTEVVKKWSLADTTSVSREFSVDNDLSGPTDGLDKFGTNPKKVPLNRMSLNNFARHVVFVASFGNHVS